jgi:hypothetical protein
MPHVTVDPEQVEEALAAYLARNEPEHHAELRRWAAFHHALPVIVDMGGCIALRPDGIFVSFAWDRETELDPSLSPYDVHVARGVASRKFPTIAGLAPQRTRTSETCPYCRGVRYGGSRKSKRHLPVRWTWMASWS